MGGNLEAAKMYGINTDIMRFSVYMCGGFCTGLAAIVATARAASAGVGAGTGMEMDAIAAVVIGGTGTISSAVTRLVAQVRLGAISVQSRQQFG